LIFKRGLPDAYKNLNDPIAQLTGKTVEVTAVKGDKLQVSVGDTVWPAVSEAHFLKIVKFFIKILFMSSFINDSLFNKTKNYLTKNKKRGKIASRTGNGLVMVIPLIISFQNNRLVFLRSVFFQDTPPMTF